MPAYDDPYEARHRFEQRILEELSEIKEKQATALARLEAMDDHEGRIRKLELDGAVMKQRTSLWGGITGALAAGITLAANYILGRK